MFLLYRLDMMSDTAEAAFTSWSESHNGRPVPDYTRTLVEGVLFRKEAIDQSIAARAEGWTLERMPLVDLAIMRLAVFEMKYGGEVPVSAAINEAVEIAKAYGTDDSPRFINGVLGRIAEEPAASDG